MPKASVRTFLRNLRQTVADRNFDLERPVRDLIESLAFEVVLQETQPELSGQTVIPLDEE